MKKEFMPVSWVDLFVTERCNLNCSYCFHKQNPKDMSDQTMEKSIELLRGKIADDCIFNFFGGEALLRQDFCIKWHKELLREFKKCRFAISTNAVVFPDKMIDYLNTPLFDVQISYDGTFQDKNRGRAEDVRKNIERYVDILRGGNVHFRLTFTPETVGGLYESIMDIYKRGGRRISHQADISLEWSEEHFCEYKKQLEMLYKEKEVLKDIQLYFCQCQRVTNEKKSICAMGKGLIAIDATGDIFPCHRAIKFPEFKIGNVYDGSLNRGMFVGLAMDMCEECPVSSTCHPCAIANYELSGSLVDNPSSTCRINEIEYEMSLNEYRESNREMIENELIIRKMIPVLEDLKTSGSDAIKILSEAFDGRH